MNKLFTKVASICLGLAMAVGVGVAVSNHVKNIVEPTQINAAEGDTHDMGITQSTGLNKGASIPSINIPAQSYTVKKVTLNVRYNKSINPAATIACSVGGVSWGSSNFGTSHTADVEFTGTAAQGAIAITFTNHCTGSKDQGTLYINSVILTEGPAPHVNVSSVSVDPTSTTLLPGGTYNLAEHVTVLPNNASDKTVSYEVTESEPAGCVEVSSAGLVTAKEDGIAEITVTSVDDGTKTAVFTVNVETPSVPTISLDKSSLEGFVDGSTSLTADFASLNGSLTWSQSSPDGGAVILGTPNTSTPGKSIVSVTYKSAGTITIIAKDSGSDTQQTCSVVVSKTLTGNIITETITDENSFLNFTTSYGAGGATAGDGVVWTLSSDGTESNFDSTSGIHYGTSSASVTYVELTTSQVSGKIKSVVVNTRDAQECATVSVTVGGTAFTSSSSTTATNTSSNFTFTGEKNGTIVVRVDRGSSKTKAIYVKSINVTYEKVTIGDDIKNTNVLAQKAIIEFAESFAGKMDAVCDELTGNTTVAGENGLNAKWSEASSVFSAKRNSLSSSNQEVFDKLAKFATENDEGDTLQKALSSYKYIYGKYKTQLTGGDFLNSVSGRQAVSGASYISPFTTLDTTIPVTIIVIVSVTSLIAVSGFFLMKRKEHR